MFRILEKDYANALYAAYKGFKPGTEGDGNFDSVVLHAVNDILQTHPATGIPQLGSEQKFNSVSKPAKSTAANLQSLFTSAATPSYNVILIGEAHDSQADIARANDLLAALGAHPATLTASMAVFERGLKYRTPSVDVIASVFEEFVIRPDNIPVTFPDNCPRGLSVFCAQLTESQRSMAVAGYMAACAGAGPQGAKANFLVFFGANHSDILTYFEKFVTQCGVPYMCKLQRNYTFVESSV
ncbi:hypothetical protein N015_18790 [Pseudomonas asturiensis]|uniref:Haem-binding uptake Tiki superfamily ChaN domain-containing protein n=1 Tax=Pseudomonas asturiensis TaxID=1190415 RepID=A0ABX6HFJ1_9PSED|nr:hypothetical protein [Pseudomonas asturiensis]QHF04342.1 hypothetical protein N015_18790 [Pseudomonas asturiensis]